MILSILIPTYNRSHFLLKNLEMLTDYIRALRLIGEIEIIVSNNKSIDNTDIKVKTFIRNNNEIEIKYFLQENNIGLERNALFTLKQSESEYVMFLGDDDFIELDYLKTAIEKLKSYPSISCIIPSNSNIDLNGDFLSFGRDFKIKSSYTKKGFKNCLKNSWRGHQLSGLVLRNDKIYVNYLKDKVSNIYPFIYFVSLSCLNGDTYHLTDYPVKITQPGQEKKDWGYGDDGLINEIFDNYIKLPLNNIQKTLLQLKLYKSQQWRLRIYMVNGLGCYLSAFWKIWMSKNSTFGFKIIFPFEVIIFNIYSKIKKKKVLSFE